MLSETSKCRERLSKYCVGNGVDIGFGGDPIVPNAITVDLEKPYTNVGDHQQNLICDIMDLNKIFKSLSLDYIYSSHLLEDFSVDEMHTIFWRLVDLLKFKGRLVLYLPDQQKYVAHCEEKGTAPNANHKIKDFGLERFKNIVQLWPSFGPHFAAKMDLIIEYENSEVDDYSFEIVIRKEI